MGRWVDGRRMTHITWDVTRMDGIGLNRMECTMNVRNGWEELCTVLPHARFCITETEDSAMAVLPAGCSVTWH
jgi:hypothetical protein